MIEFITGGAGCGKSTLMFERIKNSEYSSKGHVILVPEQYSYEFDRNLYYYLGAEKFNSLLSQSFRGIARQLFQDYGDTNRDGEYANEYDTMILVYQAIYSAQKNPDALSYFRKQSSKNGFAEEVLKLINDMKRSGITSEKLMNKAVSISGSRLGDKARDAAYLYFEYERMMHEYGFKDSCDNIREAAKTANLHRYFEGRNVYIDEFESFTEDQIDMIKVIVSSADNVCITLRTEDTESGDFTLFETVNRTFRKLRKICELAHKEFKITKCEECRRFRYSDLAYLSRNIMRSTKNNPDEAPKPENIHIFEPRDMYCETDYVCATIKRLMKADKTLKYRDIAVLANDITPYSEILKSAYERYDIPFFLSVEKSVSHTPVMVFFNSLLDFLSAKKIRSEQIFRLIKCNIMDISEESDSVLTDGAILENYCYKWNIDGDMWLSEFTAPDDNLEIIEDMRAKIIEPLSNLKNRIRREKTADEICKLLYNYLIKCNAEKNVGILMGQLIINDKGYDAAELKRIWACLMNILDSVVSTLGRKETSFAEVKRIIKSMTASLKYSNPPQTVDSITTASARNARLNAPRVVFLMGACEGDFPNKIDLHGLFSAADKQALADIDVEISRPLPDLIASERLIVYKSLSTASEKLYISYPLSDLSGQAKYRSQIVDQIMDIFGNKDMLVTENEIPSHYYAVTPHSAFYRYMQDIRKNDESVASIKSVLEKYDDFRVRIERIRRRSDFSQDYRVDTDIMQKLKSFSPLNLSATALESYNKCHFMYFCSSFLKLSSFEKIDLDARVKGNLIHECYYNIIGSRTKEEFVQMTREQLNSEIRKCADEYKENELAGSFGKTPQFELMFNKLTDSIIHSIEHTKNEFMESEFRTAECEFEISSENGLKLYFGNGNSVVFSGKIDRIDTCEIGGKQYVRIIDYKSSNKTIDEKTIATGTNMQMILYLFAVSEKNTKYGKYEPAGVLYVPTQIQNIKSKNRDEKDSEGYNQKLADDSFRNSGLILGKKDVILAMENSGNGKYIPALIKGGVIVEKSSSCINSGAMSELKDYTYDKLRNMAKSLIEGDVKAEPLMLGADKTPCKYCGYANVCGNANGITVRLPDEKEIEQVNEILSKKTEKEEEENGLD